MVNRVEGDFQQALPPGVLGVEGSSWQSRGSSDPSSQGQNNVQSNTDRLELVGLAKSWCCWDSDDSHPIL